MMRVMVTMMTAYDMRAGDSERRNKQSERVRWPEWNGPASQPGSQSASQDRPG
jgi:hypothetical protein